jgi:hypothetical protein
VTPVACTGLRLCGYGVSFRPGLLLREATSRFISHMADSAAEHRTVTGTNTRKSWYARPDSRRSRISAAPAATAANTAAMRAANPCQAWTTVEYRSSAQTATDRPGLLAHSYGSEGHAATMRGWRPGPRAAYGLSPPLFQPLTAYAARGRIFPAPVRGNPAPCDRRAISVQLAPATSGLSRSLADTRTRRSDHVEGRSRTDSQADNATFTASRGGLGLGG